jgi:hypothetical protein
MGLQAAQWTLEALDQREKGGKRTPRLYMSPPELVVRMSSARPPRRESNAAAQRKVLS